MIEGIARTLLFAPGDRPERFAKACASGADAVILDLEDAVLPHAKDAARRSIAAFLDNCNTPGILVRTNPVSHPGFAADLDIASHKAVSGIVLPKADSAAVSSLNEWPKPLYALIETALGVASVAEVANHPSVVRLLHGTLDLTLDLLLDEGSEGALRMLDVVRVSLVIASRVAGIAAPADGVFANIADHDGMVAAASHAAGCGMAGMMCIHPAQVALVNAAFAPSAGKRIWAEQVLEAAQSKPGAFMFEGRMIDAPVLARARGILENAKRHETASNSVKPADLPKR